MKFANVCVMDTSRGLQVWKHHSNKHTLQCMHGLMNARLRARKETWRHEEENKVPWIWITALRTGRKERSWSLQRISSVLLLFIHCAAILVLVIILLIRQQSWLIHLLILEVLWLVRRQSIAHRRLEASMSAVLVLRVWRGRRPWQHLFTVRYAWAY